MRTAPTRPGPAAYTLFAVVTAAALATVVVRLVTIIAAIELHALTSAGLTATALILFVAAGALLARLIIHHYRAELAQLHRRMEDLEERAWWGRPVADRGLDDTKDLSNVRMLPQRKFPESRSS